MHKKIFLVPLLFLLLAGLIYAHEVVFFFSEHIWHSVYDNSKSAICLATTDAEWNKFEIRTPSDLAFIKTTDPSRPGKTTYELESSDPEITKKMIEYQSELNKAFEDNCFYPYFEWDPFPLPYDEMPGYGRYMNRIDDAVIRVEFLSERENKETMSKRHAIKIYTSVEN